MNDRAMQRTCADLQALRGGLTDTSTLIYLDKLGILLFAGQWLQFVLIPQVVTEFGHQPKNTRLVASDWASTTDEAVVQTAQTRKMPVFSEDGRMLRQARQLQHPHYNSLMLLLALHAQGRLASTEFCRLRRTLVGVARYSAAVIAHADQIFAELRTTSAHPTLLDGKEQLSSSLSADQLARQTVRHPQMLVDI